MKNKAFISAHILGYVAAKDDPLPLMSIVSLAEDLCNLCGENPEAEMSVNFVRVTKQRKDRTQQAPAPGSVLLFSCRGGKQWGLTSERLEELTSLYGKKIDVLHDCRRLADWCDQNPTRRKLFSSMNAWVGACLARNYDKAKAQEAAIASTKSHVEQLKEMEA